MLLGLPAPSVALLFLGGLCVSIGHAVLRREPVWILALGLPLLLCADRAGLPDAVLAWGCAGYAAMLLIGVVRLLVRGIGPLAGTAAIAAIGWVALSSGTADARRLVVEGPALHSPPALGLQLRMMLHLLADD